MKKIILGFGTVGVIVITGSVALSCGNNKTNWIDGSKHSTAFTNWKDSSGHSIGFTPWNGISGKATVPNKPSKDMKPFFDKISGQTAKDVLIAHLGYDKLLDLVWSPNWVWTFDTKDIKNVTLKILTWKLDKDYDKENYIGLVSYTYSLTWHSLHKESWGLYQGYLHDKTNTEKMKNLKLEDVANYIKTCVEVYNTGLGKRAKLRNDFYEKTHNIAGFNNIKFLYFTWNPENDPELHIFRIHIDCTVTKGGLYKNFLNINLVIKY